MTGTSLYDMPEYYDIAFSWDISLELDIIEAAFERYAAGCVHHVLEPACGTGRFLVGLPRRGYRMTGYDVNPECVAFANRTVAAAGLTDRARAVVADMRHAAFEERFDAALNSINSIGHLLEDAEIVTHLRRTAACLRESGIYLVHLGCAHAHLDSGERSEWEIERDDVRVRTTWYVEKEDHQRKISHHVCLMDISDRGRPVIFEEHPVSYTHLRAHET